MDYVAIDLEMTKKHKMTFCISNRSNNFVAFTSPTLKDWLLFHSRKAAEDYIKNDIEGDLEKYQILTKKNAKNASTSSK